MVFSSVRERLDVLAPGLRNDAGKALDAHVLSHPDDERRFHGH